MAEQMDPANVNFGIERFLRKSFCLFPVIKMSLCNLIHTGAHRQQIFVNILVISNVHIEHHFAVFNVGKKIVYYCCEHFLLGTCAAYCEKESHSLSGLLTGDPRVAVRVGHVGNEEDEVSVPDFVERRAELEVFVVFAFDDVVHRGR